MSRVDVQENVSSFDSRNGIRVSCCVSIFASSSFSSSSSSAELTLFDLLVVIISNWNGDEDEPKKGLKKNKIPFKFKKVINVLVVVEFLWSGWRQIIIPGQNKILIYSWKKMCMSFERQIHLWPQSIFETNSLWMCNSLILHVYLL